MYFSHVTWEKEHLWRNFVIAPIKTLNMIRFKEHAEELWEWDLPPCCLYGGSFWILG